MTTNKVEKYSVDLVDEILNGISPAELERIEKKMLLAARISDAIRIKGWKRNEFAKEMGKTPSEITKWLSGTHNFTHDTLIDIERILEIDLFKYDDKSQPIIIKTLEITVRSNQEQTFVESSKFKNSLNLPLTLQAKSISYC